VKRWPIRPLGELCNVVAGGTPSRTRSDFYNDGIPWVKISDMLQGTVTQTEETISRLGLDSSTAKLLPPGTVLVSIFATIGRTAVLATEAATNQAIVGVTPKNPDEISPQFLRFFLDSSVGDLTTEARGVAQLNINGKILKSLPTPVPQLAEQRRIVSLLVEADELRKLRAQADRRTADLIPALFHKMFGHKCNFPTATIAQLAEKREGSIRTGPFGSDLLHSEFVEEGIPVLGIDNVVENEFRWTKPRCVTPSKFGELKRFVVFSGDVLVTIMGTVGRCVVAPANLPVCVSTKHLCTMTLNHQRLEPRYLWGVLLFNEEVRRQTRTVARGAIMEGWNLTVIKRLTVPVPPLPLQKEFAKGVTEIRELEAKQAASRERLDALFQSMLHRAFRGDL
jgi:type I restriction enzyme, S subunit